MSNSIYNINLLNVNKKLSAIPLTFNTTEQKEVFKVFVKLIRSLLETHTCILTFVNLREKKVNRISSSSQDQEFENLLDLKSELDLADGGKIGVSLEVASKGVEYEAFNIQIDGGGIGNPEIFKRYKLTYFYCYPIKINEELKGYINFFSIKNKPFSKKTKLLIGIIAKFAEIPVYQFENQFEVEKNHNRILRQAIDEMASIKGENKRDQVLETTLKYAKMLIDKTSVYSSVLKLDETTGKLIEVVADPPTDPIFKITDFGMGFCSKSLADRKPLIIKDPDSDETYINAWNIKSSSEMVIPFIIKKEEVIIGKETQSKFRPLGVLNFESVGKVVFNNDDINVLLPLISQASLLIDKFSTENKHKQLRIAEKKIVNKEWKEALKIIAEAILNGLGFEIVNISLVNYQTNSINTEVIMGLSEEETEKFIRMASHSLDGDDIQSSIVKNQNIEVPKENDVRFDKKIWEEFGHENLIRVFVPIISHLTNKCIGTIDAGYRKGYRDNIYKSDVQILQNFAELCIEPIEKRRANLIDKVFHELQSPIWGIESHTDVLRNRLSKMQDWEVDIKLEDIELDCEILRRNIEEMKYFLGKSTLPLKIEEVNLTKDIIVKTVKQLRSRIKARKLLPDKVFYNFGRTGDIIIFTDIAKLNQVVYNILVNAIRYAEKKVPNDFKIEITTNKTDDFFLVNFSDWGIGIKEQYKEKIFEDYFRTPEAEKHHMGTGLGLPISRKILRDIKGDLELVNIHKPTTFQLKIPIKYKNKPIGFKK